MKRIISVILVLIMLLSLNLPLFAAEEKSATILFTHDLHSHFLPVGTEDGGESGGYARLYTKLTEEKEKADGAVITLDAGDFSMGSLFQTIYSEEAAELRILGNLGFDVTTFGNHEFDFRQSGFADMLNNAKASGDVLPEIVIANYKPHSEGEEGYEKSDKEAKEAMENYGVKEYTVVEKDDVRFAVFGIIGEDSDSNAPMSGMKWENYVEASKRVVKEIQENEDYDYIICLSHSGTDSDSKKSEDEILAKSVDGIDVIISGHTHTTLDEAITVNNTVIVSCGDYAENLGVLKISGESGNVKIEDYRLEKIDENVKDNEEISEIVSDYKDLVSEKYLKNYGLTFDEVVAVSDFNMDKSGGAQADKALGNLISDAYWYAVEEALGEDADIDMTLNANGVIRASFNAGNITTSDVFNVLSLGVGADGTAGYPLVKFYILGKELKNGFEVDASIVPIMSAAQLYGKGMYWEYNTSRMFLNKVVDSYQVLSDGSIAEIEDDKLYCVVTGLYCCQMLSAVKEKSFGLLEMTPRNADGTPVTDYDSIIIHDENGNEVKEWYALASYMKTFDKNEDGVAVMPEKYKTPEGRKKVYSDLNPISLVKNANIYTYAVIILGAVIIAVIILIPVMIKRRRKKKAKA